MSKKAISPSVLMASARRVGMRGNPGRVAVVRAVAAALGCDVPQGRPEQRRFLIAFNRTTVVPPAAKKTARPRTFDTSGVNSDEFLSSYEWRRLRMDVLVEHGARCQCCGQSAKDGIVIHVDHIKPRRLFPELALDRSNLQVLCEVCNHGKGNWDQTDWRPEPVKAAMPPSAPRLVKATREDGRRILAEAAALDAEYRRLVE